MPVARRRAVVPSGPVVSEPPHPAASAIPAATHSRPTVIVAPTRPRAILPWPGVSARRGMIAGRMDLQAPVQYVKGVGPQRAAALVRLGVATAEDLLFHL